MPGDEPDWTRGIPLGYLKELAEYWRDGYDWRAQEAALNAFPQFTHRDRRPDDPLPPRPFGRAGRIPLLLTHGYPGSFVEFLEADRAADRPGAHGGDPGDAFHVVVPSLPGFGFSTPLSAPGWEVGRTTAAFAELMTRLGYERFGAQGGDIGAGVTGRLAALVAGAGDRHAREQRLGHDRPGRRALPAAGRPRPTAEQATVAAAQAAWEAERGYLDLQSHRPETIAAALTDSPVGQLAWIAEKFQSWTNPTAATPDEAVDRDRLLTNDQPLLVHPQRRDGRTVPLRGRALGPGLGGAVVGAERLGGLQHLDPVVRRIMDPDHRVGHWSRVRRGRPLRRDGGRRPARAGRPHVLPQPSLAEFAGRFGRHLLGYDREDVAQSASVARGGRGGPIPIGCENK